MVNRSIVGQKVARAAAWLDSAERRFSMPVVAFVADELQRDVALFHLFLAIQECIDLALHWVADEGLPPADDYPSAFDVLHRAGRIDAPLAEAMKRAAGLRNRIAHGYAVLDPGRVHTEAAGGIAQLRRFIDAIARAAGM